MKSPIYDRLKWRYGTGAIYIDVDNVELTKNWRSEVVRAVKTSSVLLVLIADVQKWIGKQDTRQWLHHPRDAVRLELETAIVNSVPLLPILGTGVEPPEPEELPPALADLPDIHGASCSADSIDDDLRQVFLHLDTILTPLDRSEPI